MPVTAELIRRVETEPPSRKLDEAIARAIGWRLERHEYEYEDRHGFKFSGLRARWMSPEHDEFGSVPRYTSSLDAALPGENIVALHRDAGSGEWVCEHHNQDGKWWEGFSSHNEAMARRAAVLRALMEDGK